MDIYQEVADHVSLRVMFDAEDARGRIDAGDIDVLAIAAALLDGEHMIRGFSNPDIRTSSRILYT